jgi:putative inorganic carbon (HCO3(-)) transporter
MPRTPLDWPVLLILLSVLISIWSTFDLSYSIGKIAGLLLGVTVFYIVVELAQSRSVLGRIITVFVICGVGLALISALGTRWSAKFFLLQPLLTQLSPVLQGVRQAETGFNPNQVGGVLIFFIPLQLLWSGYWLHQVFGSTSASSRDKPATDDRAIEHEDSKRKAVWLAILSGGSLLITAGILFLTQSRGAIGGLLLGLVVITAIRTRWGKVLAGLSLVALLVIIKTGAVNELVGSGLQTEAVGTISLVSRLEIWARALAGLADFPLGMGMNNFRRVMPVLYPPFSGPFIADIAHAHNHLLQAGLDLGLPGLVAYVALWLGAGFLLVQIITQTGDRLYRTVALGLAGGLSAYFGYGLTDAVALGAKPGFVFWWAVGLVVATHQLHYRRRRQE